MVGGEILQIREKSGNFCLESKNCHFEAGKI